MATTTSLGLQRLVFMCTWRCLKLLVHTRGLYTASQYCVRLLSTDSLLHRLLRLLPQIDDMESKQGFPVPQRRLLSPSCIPACPFWILTNVAWVPSTAFEAQAAA
jgi:hypothetical protein